MSETFREYVERLDFVMSAYLDYCKAGQAYRRDELSKRELIDARAAFFDAVESAGEGTADALIDIVGTSEPELIALMEARGDAT